MARRNKGNNNDGIRYVCPDCTGGFLPVAGSTFPKRKVDSNDPRVVPLEMKTCSSCKGSGWLTGPPS